MDKLLVILRKPPYGTTNAAEAVRHAGGASGFGYASMLYLIDGGVCCAKKDQDAGNTGFSAVGESMDLMCDEMEIVACRDSLERYGLTAGDLIEGVKTDDGSILREALNSAQSIMIF